MIKKDMEIVVYIAHAVSPMKGVVVDFDQTKGIELAANRKRIYIPFSNILFIEWKEKYAQQKLESWIEKK